MAGDEINGRGLSPMNQPSPSSGEFGRLTAIHLRLVVTGLGHIEESFELFELF
jgi:hypothetical protein